MAATSHISYLYPCLLSALLVTVMVERVAGAPFPTSELAGLRGSTIKGGKGGGWGLKPDTLPLDIIKENNIDLEKAIEHILSQNSSPSLRLFLYDKLFLHHLQLLLDKPNPRHYLQLQNRLRTLRNRRTDEASSRFFLRD